MRTAAAGQGEHRVRGPARHAGLHSQAGLRPPGRQRPAASHASAPSGARPPPPGWRVLQLDSSFRGLASVFCERVWCGGHAINLRRSGASRCVAVAAGASEGLPPLPLLRHAQEDQFPPIMTTHELVSFHAALLARHSEQAAPAPAAEGEKASRLEAANDQALKALQLMGLGHRSHTMVRRRPVCGGQRLPCGPTHPAATYMPPCAACPAPPTPPALRSRARSR